MAASTKKLLTAILSTIALADFGLGLNTVVLPLYAKSLGASIITIGLIIASFGVARILINIPISMISKRLNKGFIHIGILLIFLGALGYYFSSFYQELFLFRFMEGFGSGIINTSSMIMLTKHLYKNEQRGKVLSRYMIARRLSMGSAPFLGAVIAYKFNDKAAFLLYGVVMFVALLVALYNKNFLKGIYNGIDLSAEKAKQDISKIKEKIGGGKYKKYLRLFYNLNFIILCFLTFSFFFSRIGSRRELVPLVGVSIMRLNKANIGLLISIAAVIGVILTYYSDRIIKLMGIKKSIVISFIIAAVGVLSFIIFKNLFTFGASIILLSAGGGFSGPARNLYLMDSVDKTHYDEAIGVYRTLSDMGFVLGPFVLGAVFDYFNFLSAFGVVLFIIIAATVLFGFFAKSYDYGYSYPLPDGNSGD
ncbi:MAG: MFS transporter [Deltaproteobacteria bacterium]|nr:MFS transporter [Deltaproteobacteria bacterium]